MQLPPASQSQTGQERPKRAGPGFLQQELPWRVPLVAAAILTLLAGIWAGWIRIGWGWPALQPSLVGAHGPLMISGFFGTLISVERAVALRRRWPYVGPVLTGLGGALLIAGVQGLAPALLMTAGSLWLVLVFGVILRRHLVRYTLVMASGALAWAAGNLLWLAGWPVHRVVLWWAAFLILTIAGERLELGRLVRLPPWVENLFVACAVLFSAGLLLSTVIPDPGVRLASLGLVCLAAWLLRFDIARKTIRQTGLPRFAAICLLSGYVWLAAAGGIGLWYGPVPAGFPYDAFLHTIFVGFVFAMIFAHAPIIFPAILNLPIQFHRVAYLPLLMLHFSLLLRVAGDLFVVPSLRLWGGLLNGITILIFLALTARSILAGYRMKNAAAPVRFSLATVEETAEVWSPTTWPPRLWAGALVAFLAAGLTGSLMRYWMLAGFPDGISFANVRHAHSHLMIFAWVTPALMALIAAHLPALTGRRASEGMRRATAAALLFGLLSYLPFFFWGYQPVELAGRRLPLSIAVSTLNILAWYAFAWSYRRATRGAHRSRPLKLWNAALVFLLAASLGAWGRAFLSALKVEDPFLPTASIHLFLDLFSNGWAVLGLLGLAYAARPKLVRKPSGWEDPLLFLGLPLSFLLGVPVELVPADLRTLAGIGGLLAVAGLGLHLRTLWPRLRRRFWAGWGAPLLFLLIKAGLDAAASLAPLAQWGEGIGLRIGYLHILLLGFVTLGLFTAGLELWHGQALRFSRWMGWSTCLLLASLLPLTGLWPDALGGTWRLWAALLFSFGPVLAALYLMIRIPLWTGRPSPAGSQLQAVPIEGRAS